MSRTAVGRAENTPEEQLRAALVACDRIGVRHEPEAAAGVLLALNLVQPLAERRGHTSPAAPGAPGLPTRAKLAGSSPECGGVKGAQAHHRLDEPLCELCQAWSDMRHRCTNVPPGSRCGTPAGAQMHRQLGEKVCERCTKRRVPPPKPVVVTIERAAGAKAMTLGELATFAIDAMNSGADGSETVFVRTGRISRGSVIQRAAVDIASPAIAGTPALKEEPRHE